VPHYHDLQLIDGIQGTSGTHTGKDSEWSERSLRWDRMAWDPGSEGFFHVKAM